jgi:hypothetical protein
MKKFILYVAFAFSAFALSGQAKWEISGGVGICNINQMRNSLQAVNSYPTNSPYYDVKPFLHFHRLVLHKTPISVQVGIGAGFKSAKDIYHIVYPIDTVASALLLYLQTPIVINYQLIHSKKMYAFAGLTPAYFLWQPSALPPSIGYIEVFPTRRKFQLDYNIGIRIDLTKKLATKLCFSQGLITIADSETVGPAAVYLKTRYLSHSFDASIIYKL